MCWLYRLVWLSYVFFCLFSWPASRKIFKWTSFGKYSAMNGFIFCIFGISSVICTVHFIYYRSLYGSSNKPWKICRTIICGQSEVDVSRILYILTYFIRCKDLVKSTALVDREHEDDLESPRPRPRLGAFSQSDFSHRLSLSPEPDTPTQFSFYHDAPSAPTPTSCCSGGRGSLSSPLTQKEGCGACIYTHGTDAASQQNCKPEAVEFEGEGSLDSGVDNPYMDDQMGSISGRHMRNWWVPTLIVIPWWPHTQSNTIDKWCSCPGVL